MALTPAEKQRAYRDRQRSKFDHLGNVTDVQQKAKDIVDQFGIHDMDSESRSYFVGLLIGRLCPELKTQYVIAGLFDSLGNVTDRHIESNYVLKAREVA